ncbi:MAG: serine/threonine protein kinase [Lachnospiraceae bacterium]|nr:serine/threonine protein kinase [Lachnospiraceae bacterium]
MERSEIGKICLRCMKVSDAADICPFCGKEKCGQQTWSKALAPGTILNTKILIGNILGKGGYGITYIGYDMLLEYPVAVKEFFPDEMVDRGEDGRSVVVLDEVNAEEYERETKAYLREARILAEFSKFPGIVAIKDLFYENNTGYLIMEYLQSGNLRKYIDEQGGWLTVEESLNLMEPVISILGKLHKSGLLHRDISPDNIMMDEDGSIKLIDFGGSRKMGVANQQVFLGKWGFAPLEQMLSKLSEQGPWTDIYGICATLYCMMTGDVPQSSYERNEKDELVDLSNYTIQIDKKLAKAIMKGLSMKPQDRQQTIEELYKDLYGIYPDEKSVPIVSSTEGPHILKDRNDRVWFGEYPMNEITGVQLTSDIEYADYDEDNIATVNGERYLRMPVVRNRSLDVHDLFNNVRRNSRGGIDVSAYRYFKFNMLSWRIVANRNGRVTLQSEYIIEYRCFGDKKYLDMSDREVQKIRSGIYWEVSDIRAWLNSRFVKKAFKEEERGFLNVTKICTPISAFSDRTTYDKVYLPSIEEIRKGFDIDLTLNRGAQRERQVVEASPCSQYVAALADRVLSHSSFGLRSRGPIDGRDSYKCAENFEGHALVDDRLTLWKLNEEMGIRPVICVNEADIEEMK